MKYLFASLVMGLMVLPGMANGGGEAATSGGSHGSTSYASHGSTSYESGGSHGTLRPGQARRQARRAARQARRAHRQAMRAAGSSHGQTSYASHGSVSYGSHGSTSYAPSQEGGWEAPETAPEPPANN